MPTINRKFILGTSVVLVLFLAFFYIHSLLHRTVNGDEAIIAEHAYWFNKIGYVKSQMFDGLGLGWENRQYHYHKLFVLAGALIFRIFGVTLVGLRCVSVIFTIVGLYFMALYTRERKEEQPRFYFLVSAIILLINYTFFNYTFIYRPEAMVMAFGFGSFYFLSKGLADSKFKFILIAGVFAGLSAFSHLNGFAYIITGFILLVTMKKYKEAFLFGVFSAVFALMYFFDINNLEKLKLFWNQFSNDPNLEKESFTIYAPFVRLFMEQMRLFWEQNITTFSILFILTLVFFFKQLKKNHSILLKYLLILFFVFALMSHGPTVKYMVVYFPFMALLVGTGILTINTLTRLKKVIYLSSLIIFMGLNAYSIVSISTKWHNTVERTKMICNYIPQKNVTVLAKENIFFNGIDDYTIHIPMAFEQLHEIYLENKATAADYYKFAADRNNKYIVFDKKTDTKQILNFFDFENSKENDSIYNYKVIKKDLDFAVLEIIDNK